MATGVLLGAGGTAVQPGLAFGASFTRGDVFVTGTGGVHEYSPTGQLVQTVPGTWGATDLCFDPSGNYLVLPGVGLFDSSGNLVPSNWAAATATPAIGQPNCIVDRAGHVYLGGDSGPSNTETITKYDVKGNVIQTFDIASAGGSPDPSIDLAADQCTIYYVDALGTKINRFDVCTNAQEPTFAGSAIALADAVLVLPNSQVILLTDGGAKLYDSSGKYAIQTYSPGIPIGNSLRFMGLDPDGTSFWIDGVDEAGPAPVLGVVRYDIASGHMLSEWAGVTNGPAPIAVYSGCAPTPPSPPPVTTSSGTAPPTAARGGTGGLSGSGPSPGGGSPTPTGFGGSGQVVPSRSQIKSLLSSVLVPLGKAAKIKALLSHGGYSFCWSVPSTGRLVISWYEVRVGAHPGLKGAPILVATVTRSFSRLGKVKLTVALTRKGRRLLASVQETKLTANGSFAPTGKAATNVLKEFTLAR